MRRWGIVLGSCTLLTANACGDERPPPFAGPEASDGDGSDDGDSGDGDSTDPTTPNPATGSGGTLAETGSGGDSSGGGNSSGGSTGLKLQWPILGKMSEAWVLKNYLDYDDGPGFRDHTGGNKTYDGHNGIDIDIATFREQDEGVDVVAAAPGRVSYAVDGFFDRNTEVVNDCSGTANAVYIEHADGTTARYLHFKKDTVAVVEGQMVTTGDVIGQVGSSGCSTASHLHLEIRDSENQVVDPFVEDLFADPPPYTADAGLMGHYLRDNGFSHIDEITDPSNDPVLMPVNSESGMAIVLGGGRIDDVVRLDVTRPDLSSFNSVLSTTFKEEYTWSAWYWNRTLDQSGTWTVDVTVNDQSIGSFDFQAGP